MLASTRPSWPYRPTGVLRMINSKVIPENRDAGALQAAAHARVPVRRTHRQEHMRLARSSGDRREQTCSSVSLGSWSSVAVASAALARARLRWMTAADTTCCTCLSAFSGMVRPRGAMSAWSVAHSSAVPKRSAARAAASTSVATCCRSFLLSATTASWHTAASSSRPAAKDALHTGAHVCRRRDEQRSLRGRRDPWTAAYVTT